MLFSFIGILVSALPSERGLRFWGSVPSSSQRRTWTALGTSARLLPTETERSGQAHCDALFLHRHTLPPERDLRFWGSVPSSSQDPADWKLLRHGLENYQHSYSGRSGPHIFATWMSVGGRRGNSDAAHMVPRDVAVIRRDPWDKALEIICNWTEKKKNSYLSEKSMNT